jgi:hypothetical protein
VPFIEQPFGVVRLGDFINAHLSDPQWTLFRAAIAFVKRSGTQHIRHNLQEFANRAAVRMTVGIDLFGTSREALEDLLHSVPNGQIYVFHNSGPTTFHPKVYLFRNEHTADIIVGSGNLTSGGLFVNYEASLAVSLDLHNANDNQLLASVESGLDNWSHEAPGLCHLLTEELLTKLVNLGLVRSEAAFVPVPAPHPLMPPPVAVGAQSAVPSAPLFTAVPVPAAPAIPISAPVDVPEIEEAHAPEPLVTTPVIIPAQGGGATSFLMTLQNTDVGVGQTTAGTSRRSPEVFIPLVAIDQHPEFWRFPDQFTPDATWNNNYPEYRRNGLGKLDRNNVPIRIGIVHHANMFFNPRKGDFRVRHEALRSSGNVGDILWVQRVDAANGFEYDVQVAPQGTPLFNQLQPLCNTAVPNSLKRFGYF